MTSGDPYMPAQPDTCAIKPQINSQFLLFYKTITKNVDAKKRPMYSPVLVAVQNKAAANCGGIAQLVERLHGMQEVSGSIPLTSTKRFRPEAASSLRPTI
jgi:hypothetical protein